MLVELYVKNLAVIEELRVELGSGLTVISGEEGAGKSLLVDALCLLKGGRASTSLVRSGAPAAVVEGVFWMSPDNTELAAALQEAGIPLETDGSLILAREVREQGRNIARVNGRAVPVSLLQELGHLLMDVNSQMEHISLLNPQRQLELLDSYGGLLERRKSLASKIGEFRDKARELGSLDDKNTNRQRELLEYQVAEIDGAEIGPDEDEDLEQERQVLRRAHALKEGCHHACSSLYDDELSATGLIHQATRALRGIVAIDPTLSPHLEALESATAELEETALELRRYAEAVESRSGHLEQVEKRLELLQRLKLKYGPSLPDVVEFADRAREEMKGLEAREQSRHLLEEEFRTIEAEAGEGSEELSGTRQVAAGALTEMVNRELSDLGMPWAKFDISLRKEECHDGLPTSQGRYAYNQYGIDRVEFLGATNPGEPLRRLTDIASGGETCRYMLALKSALRKADPVFTLVFDEIDAGIGGRNAHTIGRKLAALAQDRQVICITHLPQIACYGQNHYRVVKEVSSGRAVTRVEHLDSGSRLEELAAMLGLSANGPKMESAQELLRCAESSRRDCAAVGVH